MSKIAIKCLWGLGIFCVGMLLFRWGLIPPIFGYAPNAEARNEVLLNMSYSYLAGAIFYFFVTWLPYKVRAKKMRPFIEEKKKVIKQKMDDCAIATIPTAIIVKKKTGKEELINHLEATSLLTTPTYMSLLVSGSTIHEHWLRQREDIKNAIKDTLEFKEYLTDKELVVLGQIQDCQFFYGINGIFPITDTPDGRRIVANQLCDAIEITNTL